EIVGAARPDHAAARPVDRYTLAHRAAEKLVARHAERLALDVEAGIEHGAGGVLVKPARHGAGGGVKQRVDPVDRARIVALEQVEHAVDRGADPVPAVLLELRPADDALVGRDLEKGVDFPA